LSFSDESPQEHF